MTRTPVRHRARVAGAANEVWGVLLVTATGAHRRMRTGRGEHGRGRPSSTSFRSKEMTVLRLPRIPGVVRRDLDRVVADVRTGRFERSLSALTAAGALVTAVEIFFEHDRASFGNRMMWLPVVLGPIGAAAGVAGFRSERAARTVLPITSAAIVVNGLQGTYLHARGIGQKPGGWRNARYNLEMGPPLLAPLLVTMVGGMGLLASVLRRER
jgi:hypothetical protein